MNTTELPSLNKLERFSTNPYLVEHDGETYIHTKKDICAHIQKVDSDPEDYFGEDIIYETHVGRTYVTNRYGFDKVYFNALQDVLDLSERAKRVLMYMVKSADPDGITMFDYKCQHQEVGYKTMSSALFGLRELIAKDIVHPHTDANTWWVNPLVIRDEDEESLMLYTKYMIREDLLTEEQHH